MDRPAEALKARYVEGAAAWFDLGVPPSIRLGAIGAGPHDARTVVLVEGWSDLAAVEVLLDARAADLAATAIVSLGGVTNVGHLVGALAGLSVAAEVVVLCDAGELAVVREAAPGVRTLTCERDLEDELVRAAGPEVVIEVLEEIGDGPGLRTFRRQPSQRGVPLPDGLHRFLGIRAGRKIVAARALTARLEADGRLPHVLTQLHALI